MDLENIWEHVFQYDDYVKGAKYSASDIIGEPLVARLNQEFKREPIASKHRVAAFIGSAVHKRCEEWLRSENDFDHTGYEPEVKFEYKGISGTADVVNGNIILDYKTGKRTNINNKLREIENQKPSSWQQQLSIYSFLNHKSNELDYPEYGYIAWLCVDTNDYGVTKVPLLTKKEVVALIKEFLANMDKPIEKLPKCKLCVQFMSNYCGYRKNCPYWNVDDDWEKHIDEW